MGLKLKSPVILASGPLTSSLDNLKRAEDAGCGAVVLKSIFEEQIEKDVDLLAEKHSAYITHHADNPEYFENMVKEHYLDRYLTLLEKAKKSLSLPVIASVNAKSISSWLEYSQRFSSWGADAVELNYYPIASDWTISGESVDKEIIELAKTARKKISGKLAMKIGASYSSLSNIVKKLDEAKIDAVVLFNKPFNPDIDLKSLEVKSASALSYENEYGKTLRWTALLSELVKMDIASNTGIHSASTVIKMLLAGAKATEVCSVVMEKGFSIVGELNKGLNDFMEEKGFESIEDFRGMLAYENYEKGEAWERAQFFKTIGPVSK